MNKNTEGEYKLQCEICNSNYFSDKKYKCVSNLLQHLKLKHQMTKTIYLKTYRIPEDFLTDHKIYMRTFSKNRLRNPLEIQNKNKMLLDEIGTVKYNELPECKICNFKGKQLYKHVSTIHNISVDNYKKQYEGNLETPEYLKYLSETRLGENNPMWGCGQSENSPFSPEFYIKKGYDKKSSKKLAKDLCIKVKDEMPPEKWSVKIEYYKKKYNIGDIDAQNMLTNRQTTNSVENIAKRLNISTIDAQKIRDDITEKWLKTINSKSIEELAEMNRKKIPNSISKSSIKFFDWLIKDIGIDKNDVHYNKDEFWLSYENNNGNKAFYFYDFKFKNKIIEYNGSVYHADPRKYKPSDKPLFFLKGNCKYYTAKDIWAYDALKTQHAISEGYEVLTIWDTDARKNKYEVFNKCKEFLLS